MTKDEMINEIMVCIQKTQHIPDIKPLIYYKCSDGVYRSIFGIPSKVSVTNDKKIMGYCYVDVSSNTMHGQRFETIEAGIEFWNATKKKQNEDTRKSFQKFSILKLESSLEYWKKESE